jgi:hypothetical protein
MSEKNVKRTPRQLHFPPFWEKFQIPTHLPEVAPVEGKVGDREIADKLKSLNKQLAREERSSAKLLLAVRATCVSTLKGSTTISSRFNSNAPVDTYPYNPEPGSQKAAGRAAVDHVQCLDRIQAIRDQIRDLNARTGVE